MKNEHYSKNIIVIILRLFTKFRKKHYKRLLKQTNLADIKVVVH